ncbi:MAG: hypothetical protein U5J99_15215 [Parvularculaceae bacterium]|nr:hypothetical protein [Parvularculaceae bacterium]
MRKYLMIAAIALIAACEKKEPAAAADAVDPAAEEAAVEDVQVDPAAAAAETYARLEGSWAETGQCADYQVRWEIEPNAFQLYEMRCEIDRIEPLSVGVRAIAQCTVEGDNDNVADNFHFIREPDGSLTIVNEANEARNEGLYPCVESEI